MTLEEMKAARRWLLASPEKVPHYIDGSRRRGALDTPEDQAKLASFIDAEAALRRYGSGWLLGFGLGPDGRGGHWQGIDLDAVDDNLLTGFVDALPGYVERSPSGKGFHAIGYGRNFRALGPNGSGIEAYAGRRFFRVTGDMIRDADLSCLADHVEHALGRHHSALSSRALSRQIAHPSTAGASDQVEAQTILDLRSALFHMRSDDYALWIELGHALKPLGDAGRGLWLDWSATSTKFDPLEAARKWDSFDTQHSGYQVVFSKAKSQGWQSPTSNADVFAKFADETYARDATTIAAMPFIEPEIFEIPPRPWQLGHWLLRDTVTTLIAPGGTGKSALMVAVALSLATGRAFLGKTVWNGPQRTWLWNLEDDRNELTRQLFACSVHHGLNEADYGGRLFVNDASTALCVASKGRDGLAIHHPVVSAVAAEIRDRRIDVLIVDPFVSSHRAEENDNGQVDAIAKLWSGIARATGCCVVLVHHSRKLSGQAVDAEAARGASALGNAARSVLVLNRMEKAEAARFGVGDDDRRSYIRVSNDKANRAPVEAADWFRLASVKLPNGGPEGGDSVGVIERWSPPDAAAFVHAFNDNARGRVQAEIAAGEWRAHPTANDWAGKAIASAIGADIAVPAEKMRVAALLGDMLGKGQLRTMKRPDASRHMRSFVIVGQRIDADCDGPAW